MRVGAGGVEFFRSVRREVDDTHDAQAGAELLAQCRHEVTRVGVGVKLDACEVAALDGFGEGGQSGIYEDAYFFDRAWEVGCDDLDLFNGDAAGAGSEDEPDGVGLRFDGEEGVFEGGVCADFNPEGHADAYLGGARKPGVEDANAGAGEVLEIPCDQCQVVKQGDCCDLLVDCVLVVGSHEFAPDLGGLSVEGENTVAVLFQNNCEPVLYQDRLGMVASMAEEFRCAAKFADSLGGDVVAALVDIGPESEDAGIRVRAFPTFADDVGID